MGIKSYPSVEAALAVANVQAVGATNRLRGALRMMEFTPTQAEAFCFDGGAESARGRWRPILRLRVRGVEWSPWDGTVDDAETLCRALRFIGYEGPHWPAWRLREMLAEAKEREGRQK